MYELTTSMSQRKTKKEEAQSFMPTTLIKRCIAALGSSETSVGL